MTELELNKKTDNKIQEFIIEGWQGNFSVRKAILWWFLHYLARFVLVIIGVYLNKIILGYAAPTYFLVGLYVAFLPVVIWIHVGFFRTVTRVLKEREFSKKFSLYSCLIAANYTLIILSAISVVRDFARFLEKF